MAVENIVNVGFYAVLGCVALSRLGIDPLQLFFSFSSVILAFAFMFGSGAAKYFEVRPPGKTFVICVPVFAEPVTHFPLPVIVRDCQGVLLILIQRPFGVGELHGLGNVHALHRRLSVMLTNRFVTHILIQIPALASPLLGDRIHVSNCQNDLSGDGQAGWIVEK